MNEVKNAQRDFIKELRSSSNGDTAIPLTSGKKSQDDINVALYDFAMQMKKSGNDNQMDDTLKKSLDIITKRKESDAGEYASKSDDKKRQELANDIRTAISDGFDVVGAEFADNKYLRRLGQMSDTIEKHKNESKKSTIGTALESIGSWDRDNPLTGFVGGIGGLMHSAKSGISTAKNMGSFFLGGGLQARKADINIEKNRRKNALDSNVLNARGSRINALTEAITNDNLSDDDKAKYESEIAKLKKLNTDTIQTITERSKIMARDMVKSFDYKSGKLDKSGYNKLAKDDKGYILQNLESNIYKSLVGIKTKDKPTIGENRTFGDVLTNTNPLYSTNEVSKKQSELKDARSRVKSSVHPDDKKRAMEDVIRLKNEINSSVNDSKKNTRAKQDDLIMDTRSWIYPRSISNPKTITDYVAGIYTIMNDPTFRMQGNSDNSSASSNSSPGFIENSLSSGIGTLAGDLFAKATGKIGSVAKRIFSKKGVGSAEKTVEKEVETVAGKVIEKTAVKEGIKGFGKFALKKLPIIATLAGVGFAMDRAIKGDMIGAGLELSSGAIAGLGAPIAGLFSMGGGEVAGLAASSALDVAAGIHEHSYDEQQKISLQSPNMKSDVDSINRMKLQATFNADAALISQDSVSGRRLVERDTSIAANKTGDALVK